MTTLISVILLGALFACGGMIIIIDSFHFWRGKGKPFYMNLFMGLLYFAFGAMLVVNPLVGAATLTLFMSALFILVGISRVIYAVTMKLPQWGWLFFSGVMSLVLGIMISMGWPQSSLFIIGIFVGIDLIFGGWAYIMAAIMGRSLQQKA